MTVIEIRIELKKGVADPEGRNTKKTLESLGFQGLGEVRSVKLFEVEFFVIGRFFDIISHN